MSSAFGSRQDQKVPGPLSPESSRALFHAIKKHLKSGNLKSEDPGVNLFLGRRFLKRGDYPQALACLDRAIELNPNSVKALNSRAHAYVETGKSYLAIADSDSVLAMEPNNAIAHSNIGTAYLGLGILEEARRYLKISIELNPKRSIAHYSLGLVFQKDKKYRDAIRHFETAIRLKPNFPEAYNEMGISYAMLGEENKAVACFRKAIKLKPDYTDASYNLKLLTQPAHSQHIKKGDRITFVPLFEVKQNEHYYYDNDGTLYYDWPM
jgi:tetratricopeptide (TPR) repeat protein